MKGHFSILYKHPDVVIDNIKEVYDQRTIEDVEEGLYWYEEAHFFSGYMAGKHGITRMQAAGVIAAFSPLKLWRTNKDMVDDFLSNGTSKHTSSQTKKAATILKLKNKEEIEKVLGGLKTINFFNNIYHSHDEHWVTVDRHHLFICTGVDIQSCTNKQYEFIKKLTIMFAKVVNLKPCQLQAILWVTWKRLKRDGKASTYKEQRNNDRVNVLGNDKSSFEEQEQVVEAYCSMQAKFTKEVQGYEQTSEMGISMRYLQELVF